MAKTGLLLLADQVMKFVAWEILPGPEVVFPLWIVEGYLGIQPLLHVSDPTVADQLDSFGRRVVFQPGIFGFTLAPMVFVVFPIIGVSLLLTWLIFRKLHSDKWPEVRQLGLTFARTWFGWLFPLVIAGGLSQAVDYPRYGGAVDWLLIGEMVLNLADVYVSISAIVLFKTLWQFIMIGIVRLRSGSRPISDVEQDGDRMPPVTPELHSVPSATQLLHTM